MNSPETTGEAIPIAEDLFTWPSDAPALIAGLASDGSYTFPYRKGRLVGGVYEELQRVELPRRGQLWTFTTQVFRPTSPPYAGNDEATTFEPFAVGYIELPGTLKVEARLTVADPEKLQIGQEMELVILPFATRPDGQQTLTYAFAPVEQEGAA